MTPTPEADYGALILFLIFYALPGIIACLKEKRNRMAIFAFDLLLGWTVLGWFIALIWALCNDSKGTIHSVSLDQIRAVEEAMEKATENNKEEVR